MSGRLVSPELFAAAQLGDHDAIVRVLERAQPDVRRYARAACRSSVDAEDAAQDALWKLFRHIGAIRTFASLSSWLFSVVRRECLRLARRAGLSPTTDSSPDLVLQDRADADVRLDIAAAFEALPPLLR